MTITPDDVQALSKASSEAFRLLEATARNKAAGCRARGEADRADFYMRRGDTFRDRPGVFLPLQLEHDPLWLDEPRVGLDLAEG